MFCKSKNRTHEKKKKRPKIGEKRQKKSIKKESQIMFMAGTFFSWTFHVARTYLFLFHAFENEMYVDTQDYANARFFQSNVS